MYEDTEEDLTRNANGWGTITLVEAGRRYQAQLLPDAEPAALEVAHLQLLRAGQHPDGHRGWWSTPACWSTGTSSRSRSASEQHVPDLRLRRPAAAASRRQLSTPQGQGRQGLRQLRPLLRRATRRAAPAHSRRCAWCRTRRSSTRTTGALISDTTSSNTTGRVILAGPAARPTPTSGWSGTPRRSAATGASTCSTSTATREGLHRGPAAACCPPSTFVVGNLANARRDYKAFTVELNRADGRPLEHSRPATRGAS